MSISQVFELNSSDEILVRAIVLEGPDLDDGFAAGYGRGCHEVEVACQTADTPVGSPDYKRELPEDRISSPQPKDFLLLVVQPLLLAGSLSAEDANWWEHGIAKQGAKFDPRIDAFQLGWKTRGAEILVIQKRGKQKEN